MKFRLGKHITHTGCTDTDKHFHEIGTGNAEERNTRFSCHGFRQQGLTGSRRADKQHTFRDTCSDLEIFFRFFQEIDNLLQIFFFFLKTGNIFKCNFAVVRHGQGCTAFAEIHHPGIASRRLTAAHRKKYHKDHADQKHRQYRCHKNALFFNCNLIGNIFLIKKIFCFCHIRNIERSVLPIFQMKCKLSCHSLRILSDLYAADLILCDIFLEL